MTCVDLGVDRCDFEVLLRQNDQKDGASGTQMSPELFRTSPHPTEVWAHILAEARAAQLRDALAFIDSFRFRRV
jgi:hypothetical protein